MPVAFYAAWLPRSFTLNALAVRMRRCRLISTLSAIHLPSSSGEADPPLEARNASPAHIALVLGIPMDAAKESDEVAVWEVAALLARR
jgi:hypothetical protein